ncbi:hypothetical protein RhiJN_14694 [Ceratobasidium sp. AG-Ba]|nr:hypothetical protein RhiJN_14694 [Ceratobasidium sp. AG-Ba]QRW15233.1 hypothetical protein RhiLY_14232 [Ceratobasidium sp. AG-Ba]
MAPIETLPNELIYRIATFIPANSMTARDCLIPDRFQLALVSKRINGACTPLLYEYVFLNSYNQLFKFHLSAGVARESWRTVSLIVAYTALFKHAMEPQRTTWPALLFPLTQMRSLRELVIDRNKDEVYKFNSDHPVLDYLNTRSLDSNFLPSLSILEVSYNPSLLCLCRGRPITNVILGPSIDTTSSDTFDKHLSELGNTSKDLEELFLVTAMESEDQFRRVDNRVRQIVAVCPHLRAVNLRLPNGFLGLQNSQTFQRVFINWIRSILSPWAQLTHLSLRVDAVVNLTMDVEEQIVKSMVQILPKLQHIKMPTSYGEWIRAPSCDRVPEWTPRPDLGPESFEWWFTKLDIYSEFHRISRPLKKEDRTRLQKRITVAQAVMKKWWNNAVIPSQESMYAHISEHGWL